MRIVFCGEDSFSSIVLESLIEAGHEILAAFCPLYQNDRHARLEKVCTHNGIAFHRIVNINSEENVRIITSLQPDLISVCHFEKILRENIIGIPSKGCINLHPSLLPNYRGLSPQHWPIINGDPKTGITVHFIDEGIDTGPIVLQREISLDSDIYVSDLQLKMAKIYASIVKDAVELLSQESITPYPQISEEGTYYGKLNVEQCIIDMSKGHMQAYNLIRAVSRPYYGARLGEYIIWRARPTNYEQNRWIHSKYHEEDLHIDGELGPVIKFKNGSLLVENYSHLNTNKSKCYETQNC